MICDLRITRLRRALARQAICGAISALVIGHSALGQGTLTPPGAPGPTMITLSQMEPRTPISSVPFTITQSGAYYLTTNLSVSANNAVTIFANGVTLDLNGFTISSSAASANGTGIAIATCTNITIFNGHVQGGATNNGSGAWGGGGFTSGIYATNGSYNLRVSGVTVSGCLQYGIFLNIGASSIIDSCAAQNIGTYGLFADTVSRSTVYNGNAGIIGNVVSDCYANCYGQAIDASYAANNCVGQSATGNGVSAANCANNCYGSSGSAYGIVSGAVHNCYGQGGNLGDGIFADVVTDSEGFSSGGRGIYAQYTAAGCYAQSTSSTAAYALYTGDASFCTAKHYNSAAIFANVATGCYVVNGTNQIANKYNMP